MRRLIFILAMFSCIIAVAQEQEPKDTIVKLGGKQIIGDVIKVTQSYISFKNLDDPKIYTIQRKQVEKIIYNSGKIEQFNKPIFEMIEGYQWEAVLLTDKEEDVDGLYKRGFITAASAPSRNPRAAKKSATIRAQKQAAAKKGFIVLVTHEETRGGYGEMPGYYIEGEVYGLEPLEEEEESNSNQDKFDKVVF